MSEKSTHAGAGRPPIRRFTDEDLARELERRMTARNGVQVRIYRGEIEATDGDGVQTMRGQG